MEWLLLGWLPAPALAFDAKELLVDEMMPRLRKGSEHFTARNQVKVDNSFLGVVGRKDDRRAQTRVGGYGMLLRSAALRTLSP